MADMQTDINRILTDFTAQLLNCLLYTSDAADE